MSRTQPSVSGYCTMTPTAERSEKSKSSTLPSTISQPKPLHRTPRNSVWEGYSMFANNNSNNNNYNSNFLFSPSRTYEARVCMMALECGCRREST